MVENTVDDEQSVAATIEIVRDIEEHLTCYLEGNIAP
jgi:hypothetical protein